MPLRSTGLFVVIFMLAPALGRGQPPTRLEGLKGAISKASTPSDRLNAILAFCDEWDSYRPDTLKRYADEARQLANVQKDARAGILSDYYLAVWLLQVNRVDSALALCNRVIDEYRKRQPYDSMTAKIYGLKGNILLRTARMDDLLSLDYEWMKESERHRDTLGIARAAIGIGNVHSRLKKYEESLRWYRQAQNLMVDPRYKRKLSFLYNNCAVIFYHLDQEDSAMYYVREGLRYSREEGNLTNLANALSLQGGLQAEYGHLKEAEASFNEQIEVRKQIGDVYYLIADMAQLALFYSNSSQPQKGIAICQEALALAGKNGNDFASLNSIYGSFAITYKAMADYKGYSEALEKQLSLRDSIFKRSSAEAMAEMQARYDLQKKETTIIQQKLALVSKNYQLYGSLLLLLLAVVAAFIINRQYRRKQELKHQMLHQQEKQKAEKAVADAEEAERKRIAADLHDSLGAYAASIASNVDHLRIAQKDPSDLLALQELKKNSLAIVSQLSDTIWALKKDALSLTAISDRIKTFIQRIQPGYPGVTVDVIETIDTEHLLSPVQAFHLFQIVKEAINNAFRHSSCHYIRISVIGDKRWKIHIGDDGKGLSRRTVITEGGNGLINMRTRAMESGWNIEWRPNEPQGTEVVIEPTTN